MLPGLLAGTLAAEKTGLQKLSFGDEMTDNKESCHGVHGSW